MPFDMHRTQQIGCFPSALSWSSIYHHILTPPFWIRTYVLCHYMMEAWNFLLILQGLTIKRSSWVSEETGLFKQYWAYERLWGLWKLFQMHFFYVIIWSHVVVLRWEMLAVVLVIWTSNRRRFRLCIPAGGSTHLGVVCTLESLLLLLVIFHLSLSPPVSDSKSKWLVSACPLHEKSCSSFAMQRKTNGLFHSRHQSSVYLPLPLLCFSLGWLGKIYISGLISEKVARLLLWGSTVPLH